MPRILGMHVLSGKWVFKVKADADGKAVRFKCRWVAGGHRQVHGVDFEETFAPVARMTTLRCLLAASAHRSWDVQQLDISTAFLHGTVENEVYVEQPHGFVEGTNLVCKLVKALYGLKQAPRAWYAKLKEALLLLGFRASQAYTSFWILCDRDGNPVAYMTSVVDDMAIAAPTRALTSRIAADILRRFKGTLGGRLNHYSGFKATWLQRSVVLTQEAHVKAMLHSFEPLQQDWSPRQLPMAAGTRLTADGVQGQAKSPLLNVIKYPYRALIGGMNYVACLTRPDIAYTVNQLARYSNAPTIAHWIVAIDCLRYLKSTTTWGIELGHMDQPAFAYVDSSHGTGTADYLPVAGHAVYVHGGVVSHASHTVKLACTSSNESELRGMSDYTKEVLFVSKVLKELRVPHVQFAIYGDNKGAVDAVNADGDTSHTRHLGIHLANMRGYRVEGAVSYKQVASEDNPADIFTKALPKGAFVNCRERLGMVNVAMSKYPE